MKNTYLIKDVVHEKNQERQYQIHKNKLKEILTQPLQLDSQKIMKQLKHKHEQMKLTQQFQTQQYQLEKDRISKNLQFKVITQKQAQNINNTLSISRSTKFLNLETINAENRNLATRICSLPSVINSQRHQQDYLNHVSNAKLAQRFHKQKQQASNPILNQMIEIFGKQFESSKFVNLNFFKQVNKLNRFAFIKPLKLQLYNKFNNKTNNPPHFYLKIFIENKTINQTQAVSFEEFLESINGFQLQKDFLHIKFLLCKIKQNEEQEIGYFMFSEIASSLHRRNFKENVEICINDPIESYLKKEINQQSVVVGLIEFQIVQFCWCQNQKQIQQLQVKPTYQIEVVKISPQPTDRKSISDINKTSNS